MPCQVVSLMMREVPAPKMLVLNNNEYPNNINLINTPPLSLTSMLLEVVNQHLSNPP